MAKVFNDVITGTRGLLDEAAQQDWLDSEVKSAINYAYHNLISSVMEVYELYYNTITPFTYAVVANQQEYLIDSSIIKPTRVEINYFAGTANSKGSRATSIKRDEIQTALGDTSLSGSLFTPGYYIHGVQSGQYIGFVPIPTTSDPVNTKSIKVWAIAAPSDMVNTTDPILIPYPDRFAELIEWRAAAKLLSKGQQEHRAAMDYLSMYGQGIVTMQTFLKERQSDGAWVIEDVELDNYNFDSP